MSVKVNKCYLMVNLENDSMTRKMAGQTQEQLANSKFISYKRIRERKESDSTDSETIVSPRKKPRKASFTVRSQEMSAFFRLLGRYNQV